MSAVGWNERLDVILPERGLTGPGPGITCTHMDEYGSSHQLDALFGSVADPTRRAILARLKSSDARVTEVADDFPISLNSISKHIKILERAGLVRREVIGRDHFLSLNAAPLAEAAAWIDHYSTFWEDRLAALESFVKNKPSGSKGRKRK